MNNRINYINEYLKKKFGERTLKICIDGSFSCPNRDGSKGTDGCIFCSERGSGEHLSDYLSIAEQVEKAFHSIKIERANNFILYFQNYSNTYGSIESLKSKYDEAIKAFEECSSKYGEQCSPLRNKKEINCSASAPQNIEVIYGSGSPLRKKLVGLQIATRPDLINEEIAKLLASYKQKLYVAVELGLQTANDDEENFLNRCYTSKNFENATKILNKYNIDVIAHIMVGLPTPCGIETHEDIIKTVSFINNQNIQGLKIHSCYVVENTKLAILYKEKRYVPISLETYLNELSFILTHVSPNLVIHRISGDAPKNILIAPEWNLHKKYILNGIQKIFKENDLWQGKYNIK